MLDRIIQFISFIFFAVAVWIIFKEVKEIGIFQIEKMLYETSGMVISALVFLLGINYLILSCYDILGLKYIQKKLPYKNILEASSVSFAFSNTTGHTYAAGGAIRYLFYVPQGIGRINILKIVIFETIAILLGIIATFLISVIVLPFERLPTYSYNLYILAFFLILLLILYDIKIIKPQKKLKIKQINFNAPTPKLTMEQIMVGICDNISLFFIFYTALNNYINVPFLETFCVFILAQSIGWITQVPGGLGVFESTFLYLLPHTPDEKSGLVAGLILFRVFYYFLPFILSLIYLTLHYLWKNIKLNNT